MSEFLITFIAFDNVSLKHYCFGKSKKEAISRALDYFDQNLFPRKELELKSIVLTDEGKK